MFMPGSLAGSDPRPEPPDLPLPLTGLLGTGAGVGMGWRWSPGPEGHPLPLRGGFGLLTAALPAQGTILRGFRVGRRVSTPVTPDPAHP